MIAEVSIHIAVVHELRKHILHDWRFWHTPNGELRDARQTAKFKAMGVVAGVPDLTVVSPEGRLHFMEIKREGGALSYEQEAFMLWAIRCGILHSVVRSVDEAMRVGRFWGAIPEEAADEPRP